MTTLQTLKEDLQKKKYKDIAYWIVRYKNFKLKVAEENFPYKNDYTENTIRNFASNGARYILTKKKSEAIPKEVYHEIDTCLKNGVVPLRPSEQDKKRIFFKSTQKEVFSPVKNVLEQIENESKKQGDFVLGVKINNHIELMNNLENAESFLRGINHLAQISGKDVGAKIVELEIKEVKSNV